MAAPQVSAATRVGVAAFALACLGGVRALLGEGGGGLAVDAALALTAVLATLDAARRARPGRSRTAWRCQTAAAVVWLLAPLAWLTPLADGAATVGRVAFVVLSGSAWVLTSLGRDPWSRVRLVIDGWLVAASVFVVTWSGVFMTVHDRAGGGLDGVLAVALPLGALATSVVACGVALTEIPRGRRAMPALYVLGIDVICVSDVAHGLGGRPLWAVGFACFALATRAYRGTSDRLEATSTHRALVHAPYVILAPAVLAITVQQIAGTARPAQTTAAVVMGLLVLVRQQVILVENSGLMDRLAATQRLLRHQATHDSLTGLPGRVLLHERLDAALADRRTRPAGLAVVFVDLDDFKVVNDTLGHAAGDDVLVQTAQRLIAALAPLGDGAAAFRMSGDEFAILLTGAAADDAARTAERVLASIRRPLDVGAGLVAVGGSLGVAVAAPDDDTVDPSALLRAADLAMYAVKHRGKSGVAVAPVAGSGPSVQVTSAAGR